VHTFAHCPIHLPLPLPDALLTLAPPPGLCHLALCITHPHPPTRLRHLAPSPSPALLSFNSTTSPTSLHPTHLPRSGTCTAPPTCLYWGCAPCHPPLSRLCVDTVVTLSSWCPGGGGMVWGGHVILYQ
jgi:hypothetical protein